MESESHFQDDNDLIGAELTLDGRKHRADRFCEEQEAEPWNSANGN